MTIISPSIHRAAAPLLRNGEKRAGKRERCIVGASSMTVAPYESCLGDGEEGRVRLYSPLAPLLVRFGGLRRQEGVHRRLFRSGIGLQHPIHRHEGRAA